GGLASPFRAEPLHLGVTLVPSSARADETARAGERRREQRMSASERARLRAARVAVLRHLGLVPRVGDDRVPEGDGVLAVDGQADAETAAAVTAEKEEGKEG